MGLDFWYYVIVAKTPLSKCTKEGHMSNYGLGKFILDVIMTAITAGFWLIWIFVREMRIRNS
jgi:hypothetical protein